MNGMQSGEVSVVANILFGLFFFAYFFNRWIERVGHRAEGWTWLQVAAGVLVTQAGVGLLDIVLGWNAFFLGLMAYTASGLPMISGAVGRYLDGRERARKAMQE